MPFFNQHLELKAEFDRNIDILGLSKFRSALDELSKKFYALYYTDSLVHFLNIDSEALEFFDTNFSKLSKFIKEIKPIECEALSIDISSKNEMIISSSSVTFQNKESKFIFLRSSIYKSKIYIKDNYTIFIGGEYKGKFCFYEATLNNISTICYKSATMREFFNIYFSYLSKLHLPLKDIKLDFERDPLYIKSPFKFSSLENFINKKELFVKKYPKENFLNATNKSTLSASYLVLKTKKHIPQSHYQEIINFILRTSPKISTNHQASLLVGKILKSYLCFKIQSDEKSKNQIIYDYVNMALEQGENVNLKIKSFKRIKAEHDRLMLNIELERAPEVRLNKDNPFLRLKLPSDIKMLTTKQEMVEEGVINHNCVASYIENVNANRCFICSLRRDNERYTIEIRRSKNKFCLAQIKGFSNSEAPSEIIEYVNSAILANNKTVIYE